MSFISEFRQFAMRGNVLDLAIGVIMGAAFGKIVSSLVADIAMPILGLLVGGVSFSDLSVTLKEGVAGAPSIILKYGIFLQTVFDFLVVAVAIFLFVKGINKLQTKKEQASSATPPRQEILLEEIRDLLKHK